jgi:hypothetical protein
MRTLAMKQTTRRSVATWSRIRAAHYRNWTNSTSCGWLADHLSGFLLARNRRRTESTYEQRLGDRVASVERALRKPEGGGEQVSNRVIRTLGDWSKMWLLSKVDLRPISRIRPEITNAEVGEWGAPVSEQSAQPPPLEWLMVVRSSRPTEDAARIANAGLVLWLETE